MSTSDESMSRSSSSYSLEILSTSKESIDIGFMQQTAKSQGLTSDQIITVICAIESEHKSINIDIGFMRQTAKSRGLTSDQIMTVVYAIESKDKSINTKVKLELMQCLIPSKSIPGDAFIRMCCLLSNFKFCIEVKVEILKWMITVYSFFEVSDFDKFHSLYELFLNLLEQEILRPYVCHFLYLLTDERDVTPRRVHVLQKIRNKYDCQPCLVFLIIIYYKINPASFDEEIKENIEYHFYPLGVYPDLMKCVHPSYDLNIYSVCVSTYEVSFCNTESCGSWINTDGERSSNSSFAGHLFHEIFQEFKALKESISVTKILKSRYRRLFLTSDIPIVTKIKVYDYIMTSLCFDENFSSCEFLLNILGIFHDMEEALVALSDFTEMLISRWDGRSNFDVNIAVLQYEPICCFEKIAYKMDRIHEHLLNSSVPFKCELLYCFSKIYENWVLMQHDRFSNVPCDGKCSPCEDNSTYASHQPKDQICKLGAFIDFICDDIIIDNCLEPCLLNEVLMHYERVSIIHMKRNNLVLRFPTYPVFYAALFSLSSVTLDNLSRLMLRYNAEISHMQRNKNAETQLAAQYFKLCSHDIHNILWGGCDEKNENTYLFKTKVYLRLKEHDPNFGNFLILNRHPALQMKTAPFLKKHPRYKFEDVSSVRMGFLHYLADDGLQNLIKFITLV